MGANVGLYSLVATMAITVKAVYAFEPDEAAFHELERNISLNGLEGVVKPYQVAVSSDEELVRFGPHAPMSGVNGVVGTSIHDLAVYSESHEVPAMMLGQIEGVRGKVLGIKVDVEGHELQVIEGAEDLLLASPAIIQIEHYVGSGIDEKLGKLGYFCFFTAGHDHYFTNIYNFRSPFFVKQAVEYAATWFIETNSGRWPDVNTITNSLAVTYEASDGKIHAQGNMKDGFFSEPEYAFYLMVDGEKLDEQWYQPEPKANFTSPEGAETIEIKCFVRER